MSVWVLLLFFKSVSGKNEEVRVHELGVYTVEAKCKNDMNEIWSRQKEEREYLMNRNVAPEEYLIPRCIHTERLK